MDNKPLTSFPWDIPQSKPDRPLSKAMNRLYDNYLTPRPEDNPLFSSFRYSKLDGFDYNGHDGTISRRDPSKVIQVDGVYYVYYTKRDTQLPPRGAQSCTDEIPSTDWDLADIWYATSHNGFDWQEQGVAVTRPEKPGLGWRSVTTPDILVWQGKYYLYYQAFMEASGLKGDHCPVTMSYADSPSGPFIPCNELVVPNGEAGSWDQFSIHDPYLLVYQGKIHLYYKAAYGDRPDYLVGNGLATAESPFGPFKKHPLNPILNSGHETAYFPFGEGIAALAIRNGNENNTIQYAADGVNFDLASVTSMMPVAAGPFVEDAFTDVSDGSKNSALNGGEPNRDASNRGAPSRVGKGIQWGLSHFSDKTNPTTKHSFLGRFDCNLTHKKDSNEFKQTDVILTPDVYFSQSLSEQQVELRKSEAQNHSDSKPATTNENKTG